MLVSQFVFSLSLKKTINPILVDDDNNNNTGEKIFSCFRTSSSCFSLCYLIVIILFFVADDIETTRPSRPTTTLRPMPRPQSVDPFFNNRRMPVSYSY